MSEMLDYARHYVACGLSVIPLERNGKHPWHPGLEQTTGITTNWTPETDKAAWRVYCERRPTDAELVAWFANSEAGIGIVGGAISGGLVRLDFEYVDCLTTWLELLKKDVALGLAAGQCPIVATGKGHHVYFRMPDPPGYVRLCTNGADSGEIVFSETQGEGCYCKAPPSGGWDEQRGHFVYTWQRGGSGTIPTFSQEVATGLIEAARFAGLWQATLPATSLGGMEYTVIAHRYGISLSYRWGDVGGVQSQTLVWDQVRALRTYLDRFDTLHRAIELAPEPPPSYSESDTDEDDWDD